MKTNLRVCEFEKKGLNGQQISENWKKRPIYCPCMYHLGLKERTSFEIG